MALAVLAAVAVLTARGLARPLRRLMDSALRIGRGDLTTPVPPEPTREIGVLARELEVMRGALESRDRQLKLMLAGVAHEVRNPLGGIELFSGLLAEDLKAGSATEAAEHVARIRARWPTCSASSRTSWPSPASSRWPARRVEAPALLSGACELLAVEAEAKGVKLEVEAAPAQLEADGSLLTAALVNLVKNAVQASPSGARVRVTGRAEAARYTIEVKDSGPGIPEPERERIFEPFFTTREKGTGLGLPLARKIVRAHGGELELLLRAGRHHVHPDAALRVGPQFTVNCWAISLTSVDTVSSVPVACCVDSSRLSVESMICDRSAMALKICEMPAFC